MLNISRKQCSACFSVFSKLYFPKFFQQNLLFSLGGKTNDFPPAYVPSFVETGKYENWEKIKNSRRHDKNAEPFILLMPPPNITGTLHLGHALTLTIQDVLIRWKNMCGVETVWVPGMDHAGIATQVVVEKKLWQEERKTRHDIGREKFEQEVWKWKRQKSDTIREQVKKLGALPDWSKQYFTMDESQSRAVVEAFIRLFESGLIYRSDYVVNWSCVLQSAISDIEVDHLDISGRMRLNVPGYEAPVEFGLLTKFAYKLCGTDDELVVSTTRPETILGDVAVAVHPCDERYAKLIGRYVMHPFRQEPLPVICDEFVDPNFGTGAVKVTPAHDPVDFQVGKRHGLGTLQVIDERGTVTCSGPFAHMKRFHARTAILDRLHELGLVRGVEEHPMSVPLCSRSGDVVEYLVRPQWFVSCEGMARAAAQHVRDGSLLIEPSAFHTLWFNWLENIRDWCVSRQLWWGHRVPAYHCHSTQADVKHVWVAADNPASARQKAAAKLSMEPQHVVAVQDEDVLDTWFSAALLPFTVFGWPDQTPDLKHFYPLTMMETGHDILFFWVARMVMLSLELTGTLPFNKVLLHGIICDAHGRKMSKSLGNVISPEDVIGGKSVQSLEQQVRDAHSAGLLAVVEMERAITGQNKMFPTGIPECGADALRFTLCSHNIKCHFINFDVSECHTNKLFCNKIWQACKYVRMCVERVTGEGASRDTADGADPCTMDRWIVSRLSWLVAEVNTALHRNDFHVATAALKHFLYTDFCDVYLEATKPALRSPTGRAAVAHVSTLVRCLDTGLRALAPFMPHLAHHLYMQLPDHAAVTRYSDVHVAPYPQVVDCRDATVENEVQMALDAVTVIRRLRKLYNISGKHAPEAYIVSTHPVFSNLSDVIATLSGCDQVNVLPEMVNRSGTSVSETIGNYGTVHLFVLYAQKEHIDVTHGERVTKKIEKLIIEIEKMKKMASADGYKSKAPPKVQQSHATKLAALEGELHQLRQLQQT